MSAQRGRASPLALAVGVLGAVLMWWSPNHLVFTIGLCTVLGLPLLRAVVRVVGAGSRRAVLPPALALLAALAHGIWPQSGPVAVVALLVVGAAFPAHLWLEALRARVPTHEFLLLVLAQPGFALAVHILGPQTVTLAHHERGLLAAWFAVTAVVQTGMSLVRHDPLRAVLAIVASQSTLMVAGAMADTAGFAAEYGMLAGTDLGAAGLVLGLADLRSRYGITRLAPDCGLADAEPTLARLCLVLGWLFVGLPGGIVFFAEDLLFHALVQHSAWSAAAMIAASVLNAVAFHRVFLGLFSGRMRPGLAASGPVPAWLPMLLRLLTLAMLVLGCFPSLLLGDH